MAKIPSLFFKEGKWVTAAGQLPIPPFGATAFPFNLNKGTLLSFVN